MKHFCIETSELRNNLLVTMGARAAYMECLGLIELPSGEKGEKELTDFVVETVDIFIAQSFFTYDLNFDSFIEERLLNKYGPKTSQL